MLTPYQFASNTPIQAIDLDGLEAWFVHGTWSDPSTFTAKTRNEVKNLFNNSRDYALTWSGNNDREARQNAAEELANHIFSNRISGEKITILGHSHGGNVGVIATNILIDKYGFNPIDVNLITLNTPVRDDYQLNSSLVNHFNIYNNQDGVQGLGGRFGLADRKFKSSINIKYEDQFGEFDGSGCGISNHCGTAQRNVDVWFPKLTKEVNKNPLRYKSPEATKERQGEAVKPKEVNVNGTIYRENE